jgi:uncharacterized glyoxalase superfamily protein PhnB
MSARLDTIGIVVSDMGDAMKFYRMLGLEFVMGDEGATHAEAAGPGGLRIMFDTEESVQSFSEWQRPSGSHRMALAFLCESPEEVDRLYHELTTGGGKPHLAPFDAFWGQRYATVLDKDASGIDLFAPQESIESGG